MSVRSVIPGAESNYLDGFEPTHAALRRMGMNNEFNYRSRRSVQIRNCPYLNNVVQQDHRRVKARVAPMLGFKCFFNAGGSSPAWSWSRRSSKASSTCPKALGTTLSLYGTTCSRRESCDHLQQIPLEPVLQAFAICNRTFTAWFRDQKKPGVGAMTAIPAQGLRQSLSAQAPGAPRCRGGNSEGRGTRYDPA
jgi:hypothetical protein